MFRTSPGLPMLFIFTFSLWTPISRVCVVFVNNSKTLMREQGTQRKSPTKKHKISLVFLKKYVSNFTFPQKRTLSRDEYKLPCLDGFNVQVHLKCDKYSYNEYSYSSKDIAENIPNLFLEDSLQSCLPQK